jgi:hypothetical protein
MPSVIVALCLIAPYLRLGADALLLTNRFAIRKESLLISAACGGCILTIARCGFTTTETSARSKIVLCRRGAIEWRWSSSFFGQRQVRVFALLCNIVALCLLARQGLRRVLFVGPRPRNGRIF